MLPCTLLRRCGLTSLANTVPVLRISAATYVVLPPVTHPPPTPISHHPSPGRDHTTIPDHPSTGAPSRGRVKGRGGPTRSRCHVDDLLALLRRQGDAGHEGRGALQHVVPRHVLGRGADGHLALVHHQPHLHHAPARRPPRRPRAPQEHAHAAIWQQIWQRTLLQSPMGSRFTPRLMRAPATSRRRARRVLVRKVMGLFFSFSWANPHGAHSRCRDCNAALLSRRNAPAARAAAHLKRPRIYRSTQQCA